MGDLLLNLNFWAALAGGIAYFMTGWLWYGALFGEAWMKEKRMTEPPESPNPAIFLYSLLLQLIASFSLGLFMVALGVETGIAGLYTGMAAGAGLVLPTVGVNGLYNQMSLRLFLIDGGYHLTGFALAGFIIGVW